jgi:hypothetical protein
MNAKRFAMASAAVFVVFAILEGIIHGVLLAGLYQQTASFWRPQDHIQSNMWLMYLGYLICAPVFVLICSKGYEANKDCLMQGVRFGLIAGLLLSASQTLGWYAVLPIPPILAVWWFVAGMLEAVAAGAAVGLLYRPAK